uniref:DNA topoisomerase 1 n=1 Tax=Neochlamydia hartmannellae TaxID=112235 RepID=S4TL54_9BACT|nr:DNA topoisomerase I [Neochlamydia hartmannellae]
MAKSLIIVESPAKIKTLKKFLGPNYIFESSLGHVRDLPEKEFGIDVEHDFEPTYITMPNKDEVIKRLKQAAKQCDTVYLSPDPDREGEAIAWHISQILPPKTNIKRVSFNSITKDAVIKALGQPRDIDEALVNAQQARRLLDRIVGYKISPLLNRRIQRGREGFVSAGRVQSVALKLVVDREKEIAAFKPVEYWNIGAILKTETEERQFKANLYSIDGNRVEKEPVEGKNFAIINNKEAADAVLARMQNKPYKVASVERKEKRRNPVPPFITSTLQQEASRHYGFSSARTMNIAQGLYEGIDMGNEGAEGLITYMRTDSSRIAEEALGPTREFILQKYGKDYLPPEAKQYAVQKNAQDAHEAIRPTNFMHEPEKIEAYLTREQFMLYQLIWRRYISSQMMPAIYDTVSADITVDDEIVLRATGSVIKFSGFLAVYEEKNDDDDKDDDSRQLPNLQEGQSLELLQLTSEQAFTRPPPRYTEASLVKELERSGIGRPSTYATIMNKIQSRDYTIKESGRLKPTELGFVIAQMLETSFQKIMNIGFTAQMEDDLELIAENRKDWKALLREFWSEFLPTVEIAEKEAFVPKIQTDIDCPKCGAKLQKIWFKSKYFYGCSRYPDCDYTAQAEEIAFNKDDYAEDFNWEQPCPQCNSAMKVRHGRFGAFLGCTNYPECKGIVNIPKKGEVVIPQEDMPKCPAIGCEGHMVARKSRFGKTFYSCSTYPECDVIVNDLSQLDSKYPNHPRTAYIKKAKKGRKGASEEKSSKTTSKKTSSKKAAKKNSTDTKKKTRTQPSVKVSKDLENIVGAAEMTRGEIIKKLWDYIKEHKLQDANNKRLITPDAALAKLFGSQESLDMMKLAGVVNKHIQK